MRSAGLPTESFLMNAALEQINHAASLIAPEIVLLGTVCVMFLVGPFLVSDTGQAAKGLRYRWGGMALVAIGAAWLIWFNNVPETVVNGPFRSDGLVWYTRCLSLVGGAVLTLLLWNQIGDEHAAEGFACLLAIIAGTNLVAAANDLIGLFLCSGACEHSDVRDFVSDPKRAWDARSNH